MARIFITTLCVLTYFCIQNSLVFIKHRLELQCVNMVIWISVLVCVSMLLMLWKKIMPETKCSYLLPRSGLDNLFIIMFYLSHNHFQYL